MRIMKNRISQLFIIFCLFIFFLPVPGHAKNYVQYISNGRIDWANGVVEAIGLACPRKNQSNPAQARALTKREAENLAKENLLNIIKEMRIDSENSIGHYMDRPNFPTTDLSALLRRAEVVERAVLENGCVKTVVAMSVAGSFAELILPKNILTIKTIQHPPLESRKEEGFSGLVVDCRGLAVKPAMVPVILDEDGNVIYGSAYISREHAVRTGVASYLRDLAAAKNNTRVAPRALTVKAIKALKGRDSDVVISNDDGAKIRRNPTNLGFLQKGRVLIVLD
jgi:hypothetical protein